MKTLIKLEENPEVLIVSNVTSFLNPTFVYVPTLDYAIKEDTKFFKDTYLKDNIISISGYLEGIDEKLYNNNLTKVYKIHNDYKEHNLKRLRKVKIKDLLELQKLLEDNFLSNLSNKLKGSFKDLVVTCFDEEIYEMNEFMILSNNYKEILKMLDLLRSLLNLEVAYIAIKNTNAKSIKKVRSIIGTYPNLKLVLLPDKYLMSMDENVSSYLNLKVDDTLVLKTTEIDMMESLMEGKYLDHKYITVSGDALKKSLIIDTKLGVSLKEIEEEFLKIKPCEYNIYYNGYLQGEKVNSEDLIITKDTSSIVFKKEEEEMQECINCGACNKICPQNINVLKCFKDNLRSKRCLNCGLCNYVCPANINLKERIKDD